MGSLGVFCSKCRAAFSERIARQKCGSEAFTRVYVIKRIRDEVFQCKCEGCGHLWQSKSPKAAELLAKRLRVEA